MRASRAERASRLRARAVALETWRDGEEVRARHTTLHPAEVLAGVPYRLRKRCTVLRGGRPARVEYGENDHCCARFALADGWLRERHLQAEGRVGHAQARLARARDVVAVTLERLVREPLLFLHPAGAGCAEYDEARASAAAHPPSGRGSREPIPIER